MVLQKRLNYGFSGYQSPPVPKAPRSIRRRRLFRKPIIDGDQMCAFNLLATVAGELLLERNSPCSEVSIEKESVHNCCNEGLLAKDDDKSVVPSGTEILVDDENIQLEDLATKVETDDVFSLQVFNNSLVEEGGTKMEIEPLGTVHVLNSEKVELCDADNNETLDNNKKNPLAVASLENKIMKLECIRNDSPSALWGDVNLGVRDDDEKFSGFPQSRTRIKTCRPLARLRERGIKKMSALRYWNVNAQLRNKENLKDGMKPMICNGKNFYKLNRPRRDYPYKKRKHIFNRSKISCHGGGIRKGGISNSHGKANGGAFGKSASTTGQNASFKSRDSHVRLRIKSFRIPELLVELPETATVGSLKRTVMEAVSAILSGGLRVGVVMQGKKVGDDSRTLLQTGITHDDKIDALGFILEPNPSETTTTTTTTTVSCENTAFQNSSGTHLSMKRICDAPPILPPLSNKFGDIVKSDHHMASSTPDMLSDDRSKEDFRRLVSVPPPINVEALSAIPMTISKRSLVVQRRIRRPFAVSEVEALVEAVEKLGTGRWRDVKMQAFDNAKHRTYVDLKDKWKTLVHTAKISPQQRRGQPVPQELLDRVLVAHAYWTHRQVGHQQQQKEPHEFFGLGGF